MTTPGHWRTGCNGHGARRWFVWRPKDATQYGGQADYQLDKRGNIRRFATPKPALMIARKLNEGNKA